MYEVGDQVIVKLQDDTASAVSQHGAPGRVVEIIAPGAARHGTNSVTWYLVAFDPPLKWPGSVDRVTHMECRPDFLLPANSD
jgi:hypothetical protein